LTVKTINDSKPLIGGTAFAVKLTKGTKYGKERTIKVTRKLMEMTKDFIDFERKNIVGGRIDDDFLFPTTFAGNTIQLSNSSIASIISDNELGITTHPLRRFGLSLFAIALFTIGAIKESVDKLSDERKSLDLKSIQKQLAEQAGHESFDTTLQRYIDMAAAHVMQLDHEALLLNELKARLLENESIISEIKEQLARSKDSKEHFVESGLVEMICKNREKGSENREKIVLSNDTTLI
jgi:integrase